MSVDNAVQFAIVREDPSVELAVLDRSHAASALLVASGGCSALSIHARAPNVALTLLDMNPAQLALVDKKVDALRTHAPGSSGRARAFGLYADDPASLSGCGNFESLFRIFRAVLDDLVMPAADRRTMLATVDGRDALLPELVENKYWPVAFAMAFSDAILEAMFTTQATQHAERGSYPGYFRRVIERGLHRDDVDSNPWLHHVLLGHWLPRALPDFLTQPCTLPPSGFARVQATMQDAPDFGAFGMVSLSNLFDWMPTDVVRTIVDRLSRECRPGTAVVVRQLNNTAPLERMFGPAFTLDEALSSALLARDQSLFYERILVFTKSGS